MLLFLLLLLLLLSLTGADPGFFVRRSRFPNVIRGGGGEKVLKIMLAIKYMLVREALVILDSLINHFL